VEWFNAGRARHSVRAAACQRTLTDSPRRRARSDAPHHPRFTVLSPRNGI